MTIVARTVIAAAVVAATLSSAAAIAAASSPSSVARELRADARSIVAAGAPGVVVSVRDGRRSWHAAEGVGDLTSGRRPTAGGQFRIGSVTKTYTATLVLQLVAEGRLRLDAPVERYLPGLLPYDAPITVRDLLQHRSRLPEYGDVVWADPQVVAANRHRHYTPLQLVRIATARPLVDGPEGGFYYSNTDYIVLGLLIEHVTGRRFADVLEHRILRPARLTHTYLAEDDTRLRHESARGYESVVDGHPLSDLTAYDMSVSWSTGAIVSTTADVDRFFAALLDGRLLPRAQLTDMKHMIDAFPGFGYGLGLAGARICGHDVWGHVGGVPGYQTYAFSSDDTTRQVVVSINQSLTLPPAADQAAMNLVNDVFCARKGG